MGLWDAQAALRERVLPCSNDGGTGPLTARLANFEGVATNTAGIILHRAHTAGSRHALALNGSCYAAVAHVRTHTYLVNGATHLDERDVCGKCGRNATGQSAGQQRGRTAREPEAKSQTIVASACTHTNTRRPGRPGRNSASSPQHQDSMLVTVPVVGGRFVELPSALEAAAVSGVAGTTGEAERPLAAASLVEYAEGTAAVVDDVDGPDAPGDVPRPRCFSACRPQRHSQGQSGAGEQAMGTHAPCRASGGTLLRTGETAPGRSRNDAACPNVEVE